MIIARRISGGESFSTRVILVSLSILFSLLMSGIIFGYSGLYVALVFHAKAFSSLCKDGEELPCQQQHDRLTLMYTLGASTISGCAFPVGIFLDAVGPRVTVCVGSFISFTALLAMAFANAFSDYLYYYGFIGLAVGGPCIFNSMTSFGELFGQNSAVVISAQTGGFNSSSVVMFVLGQLVSQWGCSFTTAMLAYSVVPVAIFFTSLLFFCDEPYKNEQGLDDRGEIQRVWLLRKKLKQKILKESLGLPSPSMAEDLSHPMLHQSQERDSQEQQLPAGTPHDIYNVDFKQQIKSFVFWSMFLVTGFFVLRVNFYISTVSSQLLYEASLLQSPPFSDPIAARAMAQDYVALFNIILPIGGILMVPVVGYALVYLGLGPSFAIIAITNTIFSVVNLLNWIPLPYQVIGFIFFAASRPFVFGAMAAYVGRLFGFKNFGKLYGLARLSGSIATAMNYPLSWVAESVLQGNYFSVNLAFIFMEACLFSFPIYLTTNVFSGFIFRPGFLYNVEVDEDTQSRENTTEPVVD